MGLQAKHHGDGLMNIRSRSILDRFDDDAPNPDSPPDAPNPDSDPSNPSDSGASTNKPSGSDVLNYHCYEATMKGK